MQKTVSYRAVKVKRDVALSVGYLSVGDLSVKRAVALCVERAVYLDINWLPIGLSSDWTALARDPLHFNYFFVWADSPAAFSFFSIFN